MDIEGRFESALSLRRRAREAIIDVADFCSKGVPWLAQCRLQ
ncbi:hypothetical protein [Ensifer sp. SL37]|nr:hypothetical protein [Ensifer sp. SL37]MCY1742928.1 hypothetical protein [Ensifer sp. SL37]